MAVCMRQSQDLQAIVRNQPIKVYGAVRGPKYDDILRDEYDMEGLAFDQDSPEACRQTIIDHESEGSSSS